MNKFLYILLTANAFLSGCEQNRGPRPGHPSGPNHQPGQTIPAHSFADEDRINPRELDDRQRDELARHLNSQIRDIERNLIREENTLQRTISRSTGTSGDLMLIHTQQQLISELERQKREAEFDLSRIGR